MLSDITITIPGRKEPMPAHTRILSASSRYFSTLRGHVESHTLDSDGMDAMAAYAMMNYCYSRCESEYLAWLERKGLRGNVVKLYEIHVLAARYGIYGLIKVIETAVLEEVERARDGEGVLSVLGMIYKGKGIEDGGERLKMAALRGCLRDLESLSGTAGFQEMAANNSELVEDLLACVLQDMEWI